ncbi:MAG TPA: ABC transporter ATP-binding protein [Pyrinomonadaceae bacterium]|nr:ABC transporter ATP-binding protein [Pyrinomonadaceae bacterium]
MNNISLECRNLTKAFEGLRAVDDVSLQFEAGKTTALIGPNGAGKTTVFHLITGALQLDSGEIYLNEERVDGLTTWQTSRRGIGRLFQDTRVFRNLTVLENVLIAFKDQLGEHPFFSLIRRPVVTKQEHRLASEARKWLDIVGLPAFESDLAEELSYGQQKLLALARLFATGSQILLLDEPTAGINPHTMKSVLALIEQQTKAGKTVVIIEHNMNVVIEIADWVYFMDEGQVSAFGLPNEVLGDSNVRAAYLGL